MIIALKNYKFGNLKSIVKLVDIDYIIIDLKSFFKKIYCPLRFISEDNTFLCLL